MRLMLLALVANALFILSKAAACNPGDSVMKLEMMPQHGLHTAGSIGAACLDGSDAGFYIQYATDPKHRNHWQLYFQGGGWCYSEADCFARSHTAIGSSKYWGKEQCAGGLMSQDCKVNPEFCGFNRVWFAYW